MKYFYLFLFLSLVRFQANSQVTDFIVVDGFQDMALDENTMYVVAQGSSTTNGFLGKVNFLDSTPTLTYLVTGIIYPRAVAVDNEFIYYTLTGSIWKVPKNEDNPTPIQVYSGIYYGRALYLDNNDLYIAENDKISKIDITQSNPTKIILVTGLTYSPLSFSVYNNELYYAHGYSISKIPLGNNNPTSIDIVTNLEGFSYGIDFHNNDLYIEQTRNGNPYQILKVNIENTNEIIELPISNVPQFIAALNFFESDLFFGSPIYDLVFKLEDVSTLSVGEIVTTKELKIVPNPVNEYLSLSNTHSRKEYGIYTLDGRILREGTFDPNKVINTQSLPNGMYILKFDSGEQLKFVKN